MDKKVCPVLRKRVYKIAFFFELVTLVLLTLGLLVTAGIKTAQTNTIGGAGWPTFQFHLSMLLSSALGLALAIAFLLTILTFIMWRKCKK